MQLFGRIMLGFFIGSLCGLLPLIYGLLSHSHIAAIIGILLSAVTGIVFSLFEKSPFTAMGVAVLVVLVNIANKKRYTVHKHDIENEDET